MVLLYRCSTITRTDTRQMRPVLVYRCALLLGLILGQMGLTYYIDAEQMYTDLLHRYWTDVH